MAFRDYKPDTGWINKGNKPEKVTAKGTRGPQSRAASSGGRAVSAAPTILASMVQQAIDGNGCALVEVPKIYRCGFCHGEFDDNEVQRKHSLVCSYNPKAHNPFRTACRFCPATFQTHEDRNQHQSMCPLRPGVQPKGTPHPEHEKQMPKGTVHPGSRPMMCSWCGEWFPTRAGRGRHMAQCCAEGAD